MDKMVTGTKNELKDSNFDAKAGELLKAIEDLKGSAFAVEKVFHNVLVPNLSDEKAVPEGNQIQLPPRSPFDAMMDSMVKEIIIIQKRLNETLARSAV